MKTLVKRLERDEPLQALLLLAQFALLMLKTQHIVSWSWAYILIPFWIATALLAFFGGLWLLTTAALYKPMRRYKSHAKSRGIAHAGYVKHYTVFGRTGCKGYCVCGYKTKRFETRAIAILMVDMHVEEELEKLEQLRWKLAHSHNTAPNAVKSYDTTIG